MNSLRKIVTQNRPHFPPHFIRRNGVWFSHIILEHFSSSINATPKKLVGRSPLFREQPDVARWSYPLQLPSFPSNIWNTFVGIGGVLLLLQNGQIVANCDCKCRDIKNSEDCGQAKKCEMPKTEKCEEARKCEKPKEEACGCEKEKVVEKVEEECCEASDCLQKTNKEDAIIQRANADLERALKETKSAMLEFTEAALKAFCEAIDALNTAINKVYCAVEEESLEQPRFGDVFCDVAAALRRRCELVKVAEEKGQCAWELISRLKKTVEGGKACKYTQCNKLLDLADQTARCAEKEFCARKKQMECLMRESRAAEKYKNVVEEFRRDLMGESESLVPSEDCKVTLNQNEVNLVLTHAYKKIIRCQQEMNQAPNDKQC